jgi:hypothetical protein
MATQSRWLGRLVVGFLMVPSFLTAGTSGSAKKTLVHLLTGKEVKCLTQLPATKEGVDVYYAREGKHYDERGIDLKELTKWLKERGVGVEANEVVMITEVKIDGDKVEVHLGGGGEGRRGGKHAQETSPVFKRAGGSRINFCYDRGLTDADIAPGAFLKFVARVLDVKPLQDQIALRDVPPEVRRAIEAQTVTEGMTYEMVLLSLGEPEQKKVNDNAGGGLSETWYYMKEGHRWVVDFQDGKVTQVRRY